jgi:hypothetical protein
VARPFLLSIPETYALVEIEHLSYHGGYLNSGSCFEKNKLFGGEKN